MLSKKQEHSNEPLCIEKVIALLEEIDDAKVTILAQNPSGDPIRCLGSRRTKNGAELAE